MTLREYIDENQQTLKELIFELCRIPAPTHHEEKRAEFCEKFLKDCGAEGVYIDEAKNVIYPYNFKENKLHVVNAHMDTVFPDLEPFEVRVEGDKAYCPGIGDDTTNLAMLLIIAKYFAENKPETDGGILFVCNSCEEGLGNLKGTRCFMDKYKDYVVDFVALDLSYDEIISNSIGSERYKIELWAQGGHSFSKFGNTNAIERASRLICDLYGVKVPQYGDSVTTYNVGMIEGGTSINTIAEYAALMYEYRSSDRKCLEDMRKIFESIIEKNRTLCEKIEVTLLGERPCMGDVDEIAHQALASKCIDAIVSEYKAMPSIESGSTDCNIPLAMGIPAVSFGGYLGGGAHTRGEWIELSSLDNGFRAVGNYFDTLIKG